MKKYFWNGYVLKETMFDPTVEHVIGHLHLKILEDFNQVPVELAVGSEVFVNEAALQPVCDEEFSLHDTVRSVLRSTNPFEGTVVGFEKDTNRIICRSHKLDRYDENNQRIRYAYGVDELEHYHAGHFEFVIGKRYLINDTLSAKVVSTGAFDSVKLELTDSLGTRLVTCPRVTLRTTLAAKYSIYSIKEHTHANIEDKRSGVRVNGCNNCTCKKCRGKENRCR